MLKYEPRELTAEKDNIYVYKTLRKKIYAVFYDIKC